MVSRPKGNRQLGDEKMTNGYKTHDELTADQKAELLERMEWENAEEDVTEERMREEYGNTMFTDDDFTCSANGGEDANEEMPSVHELADALHEANEKIRELAGCIKKLDYEMWCDIETPNFDYLLRRAGIEVETRFAGMDVFSELEVAV